MTKTFIIDIETHDKRRCISRLRKLVWVADVADGGAYWQDPSYSQIIVETEESVEHIENWLYTNNFDYVGAVEKK